MEIGANLCITLTVTYFMLAMCHNIYRLLFVTCRDKGSADKRVPGICYCSPARQSLVSGVRYDGCDLTFCLISVKKY